MQSLTRLLGDTPGRVLVRLIVLSFVVGVVLAALGLEPRHLLTNLLDMIEGIWNLGFDAIEKAWQYLVLGAVVVVPVWLVLRILRVGGGRT
ncbi:MAG TPA: DUF6460 domain-containing protein [Methylomirabilota bacterium]|nr:DUF6460 domain-containing protein [Methylomirabilota bacterium]